MRSQSKARRSATGPYAFTEQGALQVASVLRSAKAAEVGVAVARAFVAMRTQLHALEDLPTTLSEIQNKLDQLEASDADLNTKVETMAEGFEAIRQALKALDQAEKEVPQLETAEACSRPNQRRGVSWLTGRVRREIVGSVEARGPKGLRASAFVSAIVRRARHGQGPDRARSSSSHRDA